MTALAEIRLRCLLKLLHALSLSLAFRCFMHRS